MRPRWPAPGPDASECRRTWPAKVTKPGGRVFCTLMKVVAEEYRLKGMRRQLVQALEKRGIGDPQVLEAIGKVQRHVFIEDTAFWKAYEGHRVPGGCGQTISQPYTVAFQTELLSLAGMKVLASAREAATRRPCWPPWVPRSTPLNAIGSCTWPPSGAWSGWAFARTLHYGDGYLGLPCPVRSRAGDLWAPLYQICVVRTARVGGTLVVPVDEGDGQVMWRVTRSSDGSVHGHRARPFPIRAHARTPCPMGRL